ncbi:SET domain-containing protein [Apiospora arundinis]
MAVRPGEENVATLFADIHYFYGPPTAKPPHHRFDKGSYVYLFENANERRARIEVANQPGDDDQDAFDGFLDYAHLRYSHKQQCLVTITVGDSVPDQSQWHLPTYDPNNQNKYHYKLHSLDIYFWTQNDALQFVNGIRRVLPGSHVEVLDEPAPPPQQQQRQQYSSPHHDPVNPLVNKLENAVISEPPRYGAGTAGPIAAPAPVQGTARSTPSQQHQQGLGVPTFDPPPISAVHGSSNSPESQGGFKPMAYNPAAPAAPEQIRHREKTPPPPEDDGLDPLHAAVARDHQPQSIPYTPGFGAAGGPMSPAYSIGAAGPMSPGFGPPQHAATAGPMSPGFPPYPRFPSHSWLCAQRRRESRLPALTVRRTAPQRHHARDVCRPAATPATVRPRLAGTSEPKSLWHRRVPRFARLRAPAPACVLRTPLRRRALPQAACLRPRRRRAGATDYSIHSQVYRPTEQEAVNHHKHDSGSYRPRSGEERSKLGQNADRLERGVTGMFKKLEKKLL